MADQFQFQQQYLKSKVRMDKLLADCKARWNGRKNEQLEMILKEHIMAEGLTVQPKEDAGAK